jgi:hypothetical protein
VAERAWGERRSREAGVARVRGCPVGKKLGVGCQHVGPTWKREEACESHMEVMGRPGKKGNGPTQETVVLFIYSKNFKRFELI